MLVDFEYKTTVTCRVKIPAELKKDFNKIGLPTTPEMVPVMAERAEGLGYPEAATFLKELDPKLFDTDILILS